jgi:hypothetical protein
MFDEPPLPSHFTKEQKKAMYREVGKLNRRSSALRVNFGCLFISLVLAVAVWATQGRLDFSGQLITITLVISACMFLRWGGTWIFLVIPTVRLNAKRVWAAHGLCAKCGYDLRGDNSERCPECGEAKFECGTTRQRDIIK